MKMITSSQRVISLKIIQYLLNVKCSQHIGVSSKLLFLLFILKLVNLILSYQSLVNISVMIPPSRTVVNK